MITAIIMVIEIITQVLMSICMVLALNSWWNSQNINQEFDKNEKIIQIYRGWYYIKIGMNNLFKHEAICVETKKGKYWYEVAGHGEFKQKPNQIVGPTLNHLREKTSGGFKTRVNTYLPRDKKTKCKYSVIKGKKQFNITNVKTVTELLNCGEFEFDNKNESMKSFTLGDVEKFNENWLNKHPYYSLGLILQDEGNCQHYARDFLQKFCSVNYKTQSEKINQGIKVTALAATAIGIIHTLAKLCRNSSSGVTVPTGQINNDDSDDESPE
tara:strand:- start:143 stop:949 length:807 start_codon:yes stop_codon:yes gene_type:complete